MDSAAYIAPAVVVGLCIYSVLWTLITAPGFRVKDKHVFISGGTKGTGLAIAKKYAASGAKLSLVGRSMDRLQAAESAIKEKCGDKVSIFLKQCDVSAYEQVKAAVAEANDFHARAPDHVVCAVTPRPAGFFLSQPIETHYDALNTGLFGALHLVKAALPSMMEAKNKGRVVFVSSAEAFMLPIGSTAMSGALCGIRGLAEGLRNELKLYGMRVSIFYPGSCPPSLVGNKKDDDYQAINDKADIKQDDANAQTLVNGLRLGHFAITTTWQGWMARMVANGVAPRINTPLETLLLPFAFPIQSWYTSRMASHASLEPTLSKQ